MKRIFIIVTFLLLTICTIWIRSYDSSATIQHKGVVISSWNSGIGAVNGDTSNHAKQKLSFSADIWNDSTEQSYVTTVKVNLPDSLQKHVISGDTVLAVNKTLNPNETYQIKGELILNTTGMTKQEIANLGNIESFKLETKKE